MKNPYPSPLKSRATITEYLLSLQPLRRLHDNYFFSFNVKMRNLDLSFDHLLARYKAAEQKPELDDEDYVRSLRDRFADVDVDELYADAVQQACDGVVEWQRKDGRERLVATDSYNYLWDGKEKLDVELTFGGRSGGWLSITSFRGHNLNGEYRHEVREWLDGMDFQSLRTFYKYVVMMEIDFGPGRPAAEVEYRAAYHFFQDVAGDLELPLAFLGAGI